MNTKNIISPTLLLNETQCRKNITTMLEKAKRNNAILRPHFKTHQSHHIGRFFRELGIDKITVSSLKMAEYFAADDWNDITVAFPINIREIELINELAQKITLNILIEDSNTVIKLNEQLVAKVNAFIKIDLGAHRTGLNPENTDVINEILANIKNADKISFAGFLGHAGHSYHAENIDTIKTIHAESLRIMGNLKSTYFADYPDLCISIGDTPTLSINDDFTGIDEIRPGNFVFYDVMQYMLGSCSIDEIAVAMACPIVAIHKDRSEIVIYGGGVHFSKESVLDDKGRKIYGLIVKNNGDVWGDVVADAYVSLLSQEHGIISMSAENIGGDIDKYAVGDIITVLPVHSCMTANLMKEYMVADGRRVSMA